MDDNPDIVVEPVEWEWTGRDLRHAARRRPAADDVPGAVHRRQGARRAASRSPTSPSTSRRCRTPPSSTRACSRPPRAPTARSTGCPTDVYGVGPALQPGAVRGGRARPRLPADLVGRGARSTPSRSPTTTGQPGYVQMSANNTGGWMLTTLTYALGGRMQSDDGTTAMVDNDATREGLQMLHDMRWSDESMGKNTQFEWGTVQRGVRRGQGRHVHVRLRRVQRAGDHQPGRPGVVRAGRAAARRQRRRGHPRWRLGGRGQRQGQRGRAGGRGEVERLLPREEELRPGRRGGRRRGPRRRRPAGRHAHPADLRRGHLAEGPGRDRSRTSTSRATR